jgi:hypothetical protein
METKHKAILEEQIDKFVEKIGDDGSYNGWFYDDLIRKMTDAAECVFDASMDAQDFDRNQN